MAKAMVVVTIKVWPSGLGLGDLAGADRAKAAAGTVADDDDHWPQRSDSRCEIRRAIVSAVPPATNGTTSSMGWLG